MRFLRYVAWLVLIPVASYASITNQTDKQGPVIVTSGFPGISSQFILSFPFQQASDLLVLDYGQTGAVRDPAAVLVLGSDYTVSSGGYNAANQMTNGVVTLQVGVNNVIANDQIVIMRNVPLNQITSFTATGPLTIQQIEQALDKTATLSQQVNEVATGRALQFENFEVTGQNSLNAGANVLSLTNRKSTLLGFDPNGNPAFYPQATAGSLGLVTGVSTAQAVVQANSFVAGEPVTLSGTTWVAATANSTQLASNALGIVSSNGLSAAGFTVVNSGVCPVVGGTFTPGAIYYVPLSAGVVTSTAPSVAGQYVYAVATAESATVLVVGISTPSQVVAFPTLSGNNTWTGTNTFNNTVSGTGFNSLFASPPAIGGTLAAAGSFAALSSTGTTALGGAAGGISTPGMISIGNNTTVTGYALELHGSTPIVANGGSAIQVNTQLTAAAANTYNFENFTPTFNTSTYTGHTLNSINVGTPTVNTTGGGTVTGGYQINVAAPASGQAGALNIASGAVNLGSGTTTVGGNLAVTGNSALTGNVTVGSASGGSNQIASANAGTNYIYWGLLNTSGSSYIGIEGSAGSQVLASSPAYYMDLVAAKGISFGTNGNTIALTLDTSQNATFAGTISMPKTITAAGTTGAQTINKASGTVRFAAAAGSLVVTDSVVTANSIITGNLITNDTTAVLGAIVPASGSFTIYMKTNPTAETGVCFRVTN